MHKCILVSASSLLLVAGCANDLARSESVRSVDVAELQSFTTAQVLGFEVASAWTGPNIVGAGSAHTEGAASLAVRPRNYALYTSAPVAIEGAPRHALLDLWLPTTQPNPYWFGEAQLFLECPAANLYNAYVGQIDLIGRPLGVFTTLDYAVPADIQTALSDGCGALVVRIALSVPGAPGIYQLDNLRLRTDLIVHYTFDGASVAADSSGYGHDGTLAGAAAATASGRTGAALSLDGNGSYLQLPDGLTENLSEMTFAAWVNLNDLRAWSRIFDFGGSAGFTYLTPTMGNGQLRFSTFAGFGNEGTVVGPSLATGVWKHVAVTSRGRDFRVYVDGVEASAQLTVAVAPSAIGTNNFGNWIGRSRFPDPFLAGRIDDVRLYQRVLSEAEIRKLAAPGADYLSYRFDDGHGSTIADSSDLGKNGVLVGGGNFVTGVHAGALDLHGNGGHVELPAGIVAGCHDFTVAGWIDLDSNRPWNRVFDFGNSDLTSFMYLSPAGFGALGQELHFGLVTPAGVLDIGYPFAVPLGEWNHVAVSQRGDTVTLYYNGRAVASRSGVTISPASMGVTRQNYFGKSQFPDPTFDGKLDDVEVACRGYAASEIAQLAHLPPATLPAHVAVSGDIVNVHDPAIIHAGRKYHIYSTGPGLLVRTSSDLATWQFSGSVFAANPSWVTDRFGALDSLWAPDVTFFGGTYHLYYAASTFGSNRSCIGHATKADLASATPWTDLGPVICSNFDGAVDNWNAIDPHVVLDAAGTPWMSLGSFWGGIKLVQLTPSGARADTVMRDLATRPNTAIEASYIAYRAPYYYLFSSVDFCCQGAASSYNVIVGRSTSVTGPYFDRTGLDMRLGGGTSVVLGDSRYAGPGSNAILRNGDAWWNVFHTYDALAFGIPTLRISELPWQDGWPVPEEP